MNEAKNIEIMEALLTEPSISAAARKCGVSRPAVYAKLADPDFRAAYESVLQARREAVALQCVAASEQAYEALSYTLTHAAGVTVTEQLKAAEIALRYR